MTEVNLGRQSDGHERFSPNRLARGIVKYGMSLGKVSRTIIPTSTWKKADKSFSAPQLESPDKPAFDLVRAGVNLTMASVLIAVATSMKLPLSTTYVSFMVAMGTSLADRAWGRDSAVYRVAGVLNVIGGWLSTALIAFSVAAIFSLMIFKFDLFAIVSLIALAVFFIFRSFGYHRKKDKKKQSRIKFEENDQQIAIDQLLVRLSDRMSDVTFKLKETYALVVQGLVKEDGFSLDQAAHAIQELSARNEDLQYELYKSIQRIEENDAEGSRIILYLFDLEEDIVQSAELIVKTARSHHRNRLAPLHHDQRERLNSLSLELSTYLDAVLDLINGKESDITAIKASKSVLLARLERDLKTQVEGIKNKEYSARNSQLIFKILLESKDIVAIAGRYTKLYYRVQDPDSDYLSVGS